MWVNEKYIPPIDRVYMCVHVAIDYLYFTYVLKVYVNSGIISF